MSETKRRDPIAGDIVHEYDGIEEADNALPVWWVVLFIGSMVFAAIYWLMVEEFRLVPTPHEELAVVLAERAARTGQVSDEELVAAAQSGSLVAAGKLAYTTNCVACHGTKAEGIIGPNLTDPNWLHGGKPGQIFSTIRDGIPTKGMPGWGPILGQNVVKSLAAYVLTLRDTNVPGKPAQGDLHHGT